MNYSQGPWETSVNGKEEWDVCMADGGDMLADLAGCENQEANACLIAAAPDTLKHLCNVLEWAKGNRGSKDGNPYGIDEIKAALKHLAQLEGIKDDRNNCDWMDVDTKRIAETGR